MFLRLIKDESGKVVLIVFSSVTSQTSEVGSPFEGPDETFPVLLP